MALFDIQMHIFVAEMSDFDRKLPFIFQNHKFHNIFLLLSFKDVPCMCNNCRAINYGIYSQPIITKFGPPRGLSTLNSTTETGLRNNTVRLI